MASSAAIEPEPDPIDDEIVESIFEATRLGRDPSPLYRRLRDRHRAYFAARRRMWILTGLAEVDRILRSPAAQLQLATRMATVRPDWRAHPASANLEGVIAFARYTPFRQPHIKAEPYNWTTQCPEKNYKEGDAINIDCLSYSYTFKDAGKYGMYYPKGVSNYFRVRNSALGAECSVSDS